VKSIEVHINFTDNLRNAKIIIMHAGSGVHIAISQISLPLCFGLTGFWPVFQSRHDAEMRQVTHDEDVSALVAALHSGIAGALGAHLIGLYLEGSLANGGFDRDSDVDFVVVVDQAITPQQFDALCAMHERLSRLPLWCATQLEGSYVPASFMRRHDPADITHPNIERGMGERLKWASHDASWDVHRHILRERGLVVAGPSPKTLIDPVPAESLRNAALTALRDWAVPMLDAPARIASRGYQSFIVLSLCRILFTLQAGEVNSKQDAAAWMVARQTSWTPLVQRALVSRSTPDLPMADEDLAGTLAFIRFAAAEAGISL
jgi:hypothetical protein